jgi:membrane protease YdiL (CAAX protease family)
MKIAVSKGLLSPMVILGMARLVEIILIAVIVIRWGEGLSSVGLDRSGYFQGLKKGLLWSAGFGLLAFLAFLAAHVAGINALPLIQTRLPVKGVDVLTLFIVGGIVGPVAEEVFFRGMIYGFFRRWGVAVALVTSTLIFVLFHPLDHGFPVPQVVGGIVFAVAYELEGSLMVPITIHVLGNLAIFSLAFFI